MIIFGIWWSGSAGGVCVYIGWWWWWGLEPRQSCALFWCLSNIYKMCFFFYAKSHRCLLTGRLRCSLCHTGSFHSCRFDKCWQGFVAGKAALLWNLRNTWKTESPARDYKALIARLTDIDGCGYPILWWSNGIEDRSWHLCWNMPEMAQIPWMILKACWWPVNHPTAPLPAAQHKGMRRLCRSLMLPSMDTSETEVTHFPSEWLYSRSVAHEPFR